MSRSALILAAALVAVAALTLLCVQRAERSAPQVAAAGAEPLPVEADTPALRAPSLAGPAAEAEAEADGTGAIVEAGEPAVSRRVAATDDSARISGRVVVAGGMPREEVFVTARVYNGTFWVGEWSKARARVGADGAFTLILPQEVVHAELDVESPALELVRPVVARPGETEVVLAPTRLARVSVKVVLPPAAPASSAAWQGVKAGLTRYRDLGDLRFTDHSRRPLPIEIPAATPAGDGRFEFAGVPTGVVLYLDVTRPFGPGWTQRLEPLAEGERREILVELDTGIALSGRVVDEDGAAVASAQVSVRNPRLDGPEGALIIAGDFATSDLSGAFRFDGLERTDWLVSAQRQGFTSPEPKLAAGQRGDVHGLVLTLERDGVIEGTVRWSDGRPASWAAVNAWRGGRMSNGGIASDGTFRLSLPDGVYDVRAEAKGPGFLGRGSVEGVPTDAAPVALVLERTPTYEVRGAVVDDQGAPVERFTVHWRSLDGAHSGNRADAKGTFVLDLPGGEFALEVQAERRASLEQRVVVAGSRAEPLRFVLQPAGLVRGRVVDSRGEPVPYAQVLVGGRPEATSLPDGSFEFMPRSEQVNLRAIKPGHLASEPVELRIASKEVVEGIVLRLSDSGRIAGRVLGPEGDGTGYASVMAMRGRELLATTWCDAQGRFTLEDLPVGTAWISAVPQDDSGTLAEADVRVSAGGTAEIELHLESVKSLPVRGRVVRSGLPLACSILLRSGSSTEWGRSDPDGNLSAVLPRAGRWKGILGVEGAELDFARADLRLFTVDVPDDGVSDLRLDFDVLPRARSLDDLSD